MAEAPKKILIVDDDAIVREVYSQKLKKAGYEVLEAESGAGGLASAFEHKPDLILLDMLMLGMSGYEVLQKLRADAWGAHVPIIVLSNDKLEKDDKLNILDATSPAYFLQKIETTPADVISKIEGVLAGDKN